MGVYKHALSPLLIVYSIKKEGVDHAHTFGTEASRSFRH